MSGAAVPVTLGSNWSRGADVDGFRVTWVRFPPLLRLPLHTHDRATVAVILNGSFDGLMRSSSHPCPAASVLTEPPGEPHGNLFERAGADVLTVQPDPARLELLEPFAGVLGEVNHVRDLVVTALARRVARELQAPDDVTPFAIEGLILELLALTARLRTVTAPGASRPAGSARPGRCCMIVTASGCGSPRWPGRSGCIRCISPGSSGSITGQQWVPTCAACG